MNFTAEQARKYYEARIGSEIRKVGASYMARCPFHDDHSPSMSFNFEKGVWHCHTEHIGGGMVDFEMRFSGVAEGEAGAAVSSILGLSQYQFSHSGKPEAIYEYRDEQSRVLYQVVKTRNYETGKKRISVRRPVGKNGWEYSIGNTRRVLYQLQEVLRATEILIVEGEKCVEAVRQAYCDHVGESDACIVHGFTATTSPFGAKKWKEEFAPFFAGKKVVVVPDNDDTGREHMNLVAASVAKYAAGVRWLQLPLDNEKDDVADYLQNHEFGELLDLIRKAPLWRRPDSSSDLLVSAPVFIRHVPTVIDWKLDGIIEKNTSGFVIALPKSGKSFATACLAVALAAGGEWLDYKVSEPTRVALISREDAPGLTARRIRRAMIGMGFDPNDALWDTNLLVNTRDQSKSLMLDDDEQLTAIITEMQRKKIEFCILDVLNILHDADENDNTEMRKILGRVTQIRDEVGCQICVVHHSVKDWDDTKTLSQLARGSSAIAGFAEYIIGIRMVDEDKQVRQMRFETKSDSPQPSIYWKIQDKEAGVLLGRVDYEPKTATTRKKFSSMAG
jgi:hypothetical protein